MFSYFLQVALCWGLFYLLYHFWLGRETFFSLNRWYLLSTLLLGLVLPLLDFDVTATPVEPAAYYLQTVTVGVEEMETIIVTASQNAETFDYLAFIKIIYLLGASLALARFGFGLWQIRQLYRKGEVCQKSGYRFVSTPQPHVPFSFFKNLFWSKHFLVDEEDHRTIVRHEEAHIFQKHSIDIMLLELASIVFWCIPFVYFYKKALKTTHEYLADAYVTAGFDKKQYGRLLLRQSQTGLQIAISNSLFSSQLKKRIVMMTKNKSSQRAGLKYLAALPIMAVLCLAFSFAKNQSPRISQSNENQYVMSSKVYADNGTVLGTIYDTIPSVDMVYKSVEEMPRFPGCEEVADPEARNKCAQEQLFKFIGENMKYPADAKENSIEGMVVVKFVVEKDGGIYDADIVRSVGHGCDEEVLRIVQMMPKWVPAKQRGRAVRVEFNLPVRFKLDAPSDESKSKELIVKEVDEVPLFGDCANLEEDERKKCSDGNMLNFIFGNLSYPIAAKEAGTEGMVVIKFVIQKDGSIANTEIVKSVGNGCDEEVARVVGLMPKWTPGRKDGKPVATEFNLPIKFKLDENDKKTATENQGAALEDFSIYPNPAQNEITVTYKSASPITFRLTDASGKVILSLPFDATNGWTKATVDVGKYSKGSYVASLADQNGKVLKSKTVVLQ